ncbi:uncharacterized protein LOC144432814 [Glandiceps talaboti]
MGTTPSKNSRRNSIISSESENKDNKQHFLPDFVFEMLKQCLYSLPMPPGKGVNDRTCERIARHVDRIDVLEPRDIIKKGEAASGIYIVVKGEAEVVSETGKDVIATLSVGDYFGEVSVLFNRPCTATVRVPKKALLLVLHVDEAKRILHRVQIDIKEYYVLRRYLDTDGSVDQKELQIEITKSALKQIPMLEGWNDESLAFMISHMEQIHQPILIYPAESNLLIQRDPSLEVCILLRGKVKVLDGRKEIIVLEAKKSPLCLGEEGLYTGKKREVGFRAITVCHVIILEKTVIIEAIKQYKDEAGVCYSRSLDYWTKINKWKSRKVYQDRTAELQLEVIMQILWNSLIFSEVPAGFIYMVAMTATAYEYPKDSKVLTEADYKNQQLFLLVCGSVMFLSEKQKILDLKSGDVFWNSKWLPVSGYVKAREATLVVKFNASAIQDALKTYPESVLILPSKPSELIAGTAGNDSDKDKENTQIEEGDSQQIETK